MPFNPTSFANLFATLTSDTTISLTFGGADRWTADNTHDCPVWTDPGHVLGSQSCPGWQPVPDPDPVDLSALAGLGADFITARIVPGEASAVFDVGSNACKTEAEGGGCLFRDPDTAEMIWLDQRGNTLSGTQDDGTPTGSGPWEVDGLPVYQAPDRLVNHSPPAYFGIDPANSANELLWRPDDLLSLAWVWAGADMAGSAHGLQVTVGYTLWHYLTPPTSTPGLRCLL